ncbi:MAG: hypothetical protein CVU56_00730 [Deltaproteobacteria bacterium HGW-Deltaproteobacteria-14]|jgi:CRP-like cAMP-binding protein|nr:MAG: hypothetical protein CVU56_00730 [Deltaproteobacteria bacterium HGW-Deltaproteobacteria-14]
MSDRALVTSLERLLALRRSELFRDLPTRDLEVLAGLLREAVFRAGEVIQPADQPATTLHLIVEGAIELVRDEVVRRRVEAPFALGSLAVFAGRDGGTRATALTEVVALRIPADVIAEVVEDHFNVLDQLLRATARQLISEVRLLTGDRVVPGPADRPPCRVFERPLDLVERLIFLRRMPMFAPASLDSVAEISTHFRELRYPAGHELWREGERPVDILCLVHGAVRGTTAAHPGVVLYRDYAMLGALSVLGQAPHYQRCVTDTPVVVLAVAGGQILDALEDNFEMAMVLLGGLARETFDVERRLHEQRALQSDAQP